MKSFFRYATVSALSAVFAVVGLAQTAPAPAATPAGPCEDAAAIGALDTKIRELQPKTDLESQKQLVEAGKEYLQKYGACKNEQVVLVDYLSKGVPDWEKNIARQILRDKLKPFLDKFGNGLKAKNWDDVYAGGKGLIEIDPETYRPALLVLGSIGLDETSKSPRVTKWNDQTIQFAKQAIAELEAGKKFERKDAKTGAVTPQFGYVDKAAGYNFSYSSKDEAIAWMNYTIGYILWYDKKNAKDAMSYLYKASQGNATLKDNYRVFDALGNAALDDYNKINAEIEAEKAKQSPTDPDDVKQQKIDSLKAKSALSLGAAERVLEYFARAYTVAKRDPKNKVTADNIYKLIQTLYERRFENTTGMDAWIASKSSQPLTNPSTEIKPVVEAAPVTTTTSEASNTGNATTAAGTAKPAPVSGSKPAPAVAKPVSNPPATKPAGVAKPATRPAGSRTR